MEPVRAAIVGAGGYAGDIADLVLRTGSLCQPEVQLVAVAEPDTTTHALRLAELRRLGIATLTSVDDLLADPAIEAVWLPLPIPLHRSFTERALAAGKAVLVEKPAAGSVQDVDAMIAARDRSGLPVAVGFQDMFDPLTTDLKTRLVGGQLGAVRHAVLQACWPRSQEYYRRSTWAGRFKQNDEWVMDSPANNALAHYVNLAMFFLGPDLPSSAVVERVEAELYRAHAIENFDTISLRAHLAGGATLLLLLTHACRGSHGPVLRLEGTHGQMTYTSAGADIEARGAQETLAAAEDPRAEIVGRFARQVRGIPDDARLGSTLETARAQVVLANAASEASAIVPVPPEQIERFEDQGENGVAITGIESAIRHCAEHHQMLHESGLLPFTRQGGILDVRHDRQFSGPKQA
ncbi:MAG: Gfo/Idh/MocA family protein [Terrimicrobiaceae bacterium]